ncbi:MAG: 30S ribosomal protein S6 [bacterium]
MAKELEQQELRDVKAYELAYLLTPLLPEDKLQELYEEIFGAAVKASGGTITADLPARMIDLAYTIVKSISNKHNKFDHAYFGVLRFEAYSDQVAIIKEMIDKRPEVIRHMIVVLPKDADKLMAPRPIVARRPVAAASAPLETEAKEEVKIEMTEAEIDKEIEGLLETPTK